MNKLHLKLNLILETDVNNSVNFLDLTITNYNNGTFNIYRNSTTTVTVKHIFNHPTQHKDASFHSIINIPLNISLNQSDDNTEVNTSKYITQEIDFDP
jgi:hypothetical protein